MNGDIDGRYNPQFIRKLMDTLTENEWNAIREVWAVNADIWPMVVEKELRVNGVEPQQEKTVDVVTKYGTFKGGYSPVVFDTYQSVLAAQYRASKEAAALASDGIFKPVTTQRGYLKKRREKVENAFLDADFANITLNVRDVIHDICWNEYAVDTNRFLRDDKVKNAILTYYGDEAWEAIRASVHVSVTGETFANRGLEQIILTLRNNVSSALMGWSLTTMMTQPAGLALSAERIGPRYVLTALKEFKRDPRGTRDYVYQRSPMMRERHNTLTPEMANVNVMMRTPTIISQELGKLVGPNNLNKATKFYEMTKFWHIQKMQSFVDIPTWMASYTKALSQGRTEEDAISIADADVKATQSGGQIGDQSRVQYDNLVFKLFTMFYSPFAATMQRYYELGAETKADPSKIAENIARAISVSVMPALYISVYKSLWSMLRGDEEDEERTFFDSLAEETIANVMGNIVGIREGTLAVQQALGVASFTGDYGGPPSLKIFDDTYRLMQQAGQFEADQTLFKAVTNWFGSAFGIPSTAINRHILGGYEWIAEDGSVFNLLLGPTPK
jgi:hypothetical protein